MRNIAKTLVVILTVLLALPATGEFSPNYLPRNSRIQQLRLIAALTKGAKVLQWRLFLLRACY